MSRTKGGSTARDDPHNKATKRNKENPVSDTVFLIQNENDVLRMKYTICYLETHSSTTR